MSRSTFSVLFYVNRGKEKDGVVPVMGRVTINGTQSQFSCKKSIPLTLWDAKGNCAKGRSKEALQLNRDLDNIKAQIIKHYQYLSLGVMSRQSIRHPLFSLPDGSLSEEEPPGHSHDIAPSHLIRRKESCHWSGIPAMSSGLSLASVRSRHQSYSARRLAWDGSVDAKVVPPVCPYPQLTRKLCRFLTWL